MTSESEAFKTNEFLRRRKLRLQQVREQSKDIAKKIRQRTNIEKLQQIVDLDSKKENKYIHHREKLVRHLEQLYAQGVKSVGASHVKASEVQDNASSPEKIDLSKSRGKEAVAELRRKKQEKLDEKKKLLDRKLLAREAANEKSREKSNAANKLIDKPSSKAPEKPSAADPLKEIDQTNVAPKLNKNDMATQWDLEEMPSEWEPNIPALSLPNDDRESINNLDNVAESKSDKSKRIDLFALSSEMPSSLRGGRTGISEERAPIKSSVTAVSEYLQNRALRLRETDTISSNKKQSDDLHSLRQTIQHSRSSKLEGKSGVSSEAETVLSKKKSVTTYNHSTRNHKDIPSTDAGLVVRDHPSEEDAYSQALKEISIGNSKEREHQNKLQKMRNKVAVTKQTVEKEYKDTMSFLKTLPKEKCSKHDRNAHMDERRQQMLKDRRQQKLQQEFRKIEKECQRDYAKSVRPKHTTADKYRKTTKSPGKLDVDDDFNTRDLQYSWMPVPESDSNLAIHTIPTTLKEGKSGNTVKFSKVDSYHEYRSRHKHTPPTKETSEDRQPNKRVVETVIIHKDDSESTDNTSISSDTSSVENLNIEKKGDKNQVLLDADKIIIYKILDSKLSKKSKDRKSRKVIDNYAKELSTIDSDQLSKFIKDNNNNRDDKHGNTTKDNWETSNPIEQIKDGVYKVLNEKGDNVSSLFSSDKPQEVLDQPCSCASQKKISSDQDQIKGNELLSGKSDKTELRKPTCSGNICGCEISLNRSNTNTTAHPSTVTSSSSFKTATTKKARGAVTDSGYVKLLDDDGKEAGKFFIGASEFLKDNAYEVVIQLRKKETSKKDNEIESTHSDTVNQSEKGIPETIKMSDTLPAKPTVIEKNADKQDNYSVQANEDVQAQEEEPPAIRQEKGEQPKIDEKPAKRFVDRGENTSSQLSFAVPVDFSKTDPIPRPATSTYTQTSISSPDPRPVFIHMSSSTSTAYMSPPELVLPSFLRQKYGEVYNTQDQFHMQDERFDVNQHCNKDCKTRPCRRRVNNEKVDIDSVERNITTPPKTNKATHRNEDFFNDLKCQIHKADRQCRKCRSRTGSSTDIKNCNRKKRATSLPSRNQVMHITPSARSTFKTKMNPSDDKLRKSNLNPVIQIYVNKLLKLNKEGLKAIEVANQECSLVNTPGSSIIEVSHNMNINRTDINNKISLEQIKNILRKQILEEYVKENVSNNNSIQSLCPHAKKLKTCVKKIPRVKSVHKVKSLNISRKLRYSKTEKQCQPVRNFKSSTSSPTSSRDINTKKYKSSFVSQRRSKSTPTPRNGNDLEPQYKNKSFGFIDTHDNSDRTVSRTSHTSNKFEIENLQDKLKNIPKSQGFNFMFQKATITSTDSDDTNFQKQNDIPINTSTQTSQDLDSEINLIKVAENKLQNMEKIADLTEKCTKRLSNLAKVLEEVRKNKSTYSHISTSDTASDSDKNDVTLQQQYEYQEMPKETVTTALQPISVNKSEKEFNNIESSDFIPFLTDIPKPAELKQNSQREELTQMDTSTLQSSINHGVDNISLKNRGRPPPALSRINLKHTQGVIPHELSTVLEVDSPMSIKLKNLSSRSNTKCDVSDTSNKLLNDNENQIEVNNQDLISKKTELLVNPDLLLSNISKSRRQLKMQQTLSTNPSDESKLKMMDLKQFNEVMLKPFISLQEYAKQCDIGILDEGSNIDDNLKDDYNEELSSLHSDGSLPDVIAELLKRNIITEPFKFDLASNTNSTTVSSESMLSVLALSKIRKAKKKSSVVFHNKENISETSDTLSMSSNPDLENAFKKMGLGWASSTLKKTKERLALSSSSNTSSSSLTQFKMKNFNNQDIPVLVTDSASSATGASKKLKQAKNSADFSKNAEQQTSFTNSMTVKEFLTNELAKKITFSNKSNRNNTDEDFVSLLETKMPEEMKVSLQDMPEAEQSVDSYPSANNNRARTSTPVQIFKSMTYHSSSSSNMSNGLFSNADDLSSVKVTSNSIRNHSTSDKDDLTIPNCSLKIRKGATDSSKSD